MPRSSPNLSIACSFSILLGLTGSALAAPGELDCGFGVGGTVNLNLDSVEAAFDIGLQSDGRIVAIGSDGAQIRLTRFTTAGALDATFSGAGSVLHNFASSVAELAIDSQNRIIAVGGISNPDSDVFVARFTANGVIDTSFGGGDGWLSFDFDAATNGAGRDGVMGVAIDASDRIVVVGFMDANGNTFHPSNSDQAIARITAQGILDNSFGGGDGLALASSPGTDRDDDARSIAIDSLGRIAVSGSTYFGNASNNGPRSTMVARWTASGVLDNTFDGDGVAILDLSQAGTDDFGVDLAVDSNNQLMVLGVLSDDPVIARLLNNGSLDNSFGGGDGIVARSFIGGQDVTEHIVMQADGKFLVTGWPVVGSSFHFASMRFTSTGALDTSWGGTGVVTTAISFNERAYSALLQPDQKLILAGGLNNDLNFVMARYFNDGQGPVATTTAITTHTPDPSWPGQLVQVAYTVSAAGGGAVTGNVTVSDGVSSCIGSVAAGSCNVALSTLGTRQLTAQYAGGTCISGSISAQVAHNVQVIPFIVTPSAGSGGALNPSTAQIINGGQSASFQVLPDPGHRIVNVSGCSGVLSGNTYNIAGVSASCTVTATFNRNPVANPAQLFLIEDSGMQVGTLDASDDGPLTFSLVSNATRGNVVINNANTGAYTYTPNANANGTDFFLFKVNDGGVDSATTAVGIDITAINDAPTFTLTGTPVSFAAGTTGFQTVTGFAQIDLGPPDEDASQSLLDYQIVARTDPDGVLNASSGAVAIGSDGTLHTLLTGVGGVASVSVLARDNGGTFGGGIDTSDTQTFTISVAPGADLQVAITDHRNTLAPGDSTTYVIVVGNAGPNSVAGAQLSGVLPAQLINANWTCVQANSIAPCPTPANGNGNLNTVVNLPANRFIQFDVTATANANNGDTLNHTVSIAAPANITEFDSSNNTATDTNTVVVDAVFDDGFEEAGSVLTVPGAAEALR